MAQLSGPVTIEGTVIRVISEHPEGQPIISHATVRVEKVLEGSLAADEVVITYLGGTVGELTLRVSHEPELATGMRIRVKLNSTEGGDYRINDVESDLEIMEDAVRPAFVTHGSWNDADIPVLARVNANTADVAGTGEATAIFTAMNTWFDAACNYFEFVGAQNACTLNRNNTDGVNCVGWAPGPKDTGSNALASTFWWYQSGTRIREFDMFFWENEANGAINWSTNPGANDYDVETVALHELGHALGLNHTSVSGAVMWPSVATGTTLRSLAQDDIDAICSLYRVPGPGNIFVDRNAQGLQNGESNHPFRTVQKGFRAVSANGNLRIRPGSYNERPIINQPMTIYSTGGLVTIGQ